MPSILTRPSGGGAGGGASVSISLSNSTPRFKESITLTATASGITPTSYTFTATNGVDSVTIYTGVNNSTTWQPSFAGTITISVTATDGSDTVAASDEITIGGFIMSALTWSNAVTNGYDRRTFVIPTESSSTYNCTVYWINEDGTLDGSDVITTYNDAAWSHQFATEGLKYVQVVGTFGELNGRNGTGFQEFKAKVRIIYNWGGAEINQQQCFNSSNLESIVALDAVSIGGSTSGFNMFNGCDSIKTINFCDTDFSACTRFDDFCKNSYALTFTDHDWLSTIDTVTDFNEGFRAMPRQDFHLRNINWTNISNWTNTLIQTATNKDDYEQTLVNILADNPTPMAMHFGYSQYDSGSAAETAKNTLIGLGFAFTDGGAI